MYFFIAETVRLTHHEPISSPATPTPTTPAAYGSLQSNLVSRDAYGTSTSASSYVFQYFGVRRRRWVWYRWRKTWVLASACASLKCWGRGSRGCWFATSLCRMSFTHRGQILLECSGRQVALCVPEVRRMWGGVRNPILMLWTRRSHLLQRGLSPVSVLTYIHRFIPPDFY